jgi:prevent-host-death family protein
MKKKIKEIPPYRQRPPVAKEPAPAAARETRGPMELRETMALPGVGLSIPVRAAKAKFSALLEMVAGGREVTITSDGRPKAVLSPVEKRKERKVFTGTREHLKKMPPWRGGPTAEEIIREDRDGRGW